MKTQQIKLFQVPYTGLDVNKTYRLITKFRLDKQSGVVFQTDNMFSPSTSAGVFTITILKDQLPQRGKVFADNYLYVFKDNHWDFLVAKTQILEGNDTLLEVKTNQTLIGDGLIDNAIHYLWDQRQENERAEVQEILSNKSCKDIQKSKCKNNYETQIQQSNEDYHWTLAEVNRIKERIEELKVNKKALLDEYDRMYAKAQIPQIKQDCPKELQILGRFKKKLNKIKVEKEKVLNKYYCVRQELEEMQSQIQLMEKKISKQKQVKTELNQQLNCLVSDVNSQKKIVNNRQAQKYSRINDDLVNGLMKQHQFPKEIIGYTWHIETRNQFLINNESYPIVYALIGKHHDNALLKIGSSIDFPHRQAVYDYYEDDGYFDKGSMVIVSQAILSNISNPRVLELLIRYIFEYQYEKAKIYGNEWFSCNAQMLTDLQMIFNYVDRHLQSNGALDTFIKGLVNLSDDQRYVKTKQKAKEIGKYLFK